MEHMKQLKQATVDEAAKKLQDAKDKEIRAIDKKNMSACKKLMRDMVAEVGKIEKERLSKEKEECRVQGLEAAPQQRVTSKIRKMLTDRCSVCCGLCSDYTAAQQNRWVGCSYCDYRSIACTLRIWQLMRKFANHSLRSESEY